MLIFLSAYGTKRGFNRTVGDLRFRRARLFDAGAVGPIIDSQLLARADRSTGDKSSAVLGPQVRTRRMVDVGS